MLAAPLPDPEVYTPSLRWVDAATWTFEDAFADLDERRWAALTDEGASAEATVPSGLILDSGWVPAGGAPSGVALVTLDEVVEGSFELRLEFQIDIMLGGVIFAFGTVAFGEDLQSFLLSGINQVEDSGGPLRFLSLIDRGQAGDLFVLQLVDPDFDFTATPVTLEIVYAAESSAVAARIEPLGVSLSLTGVTIPEARRLATWAAVPGVDGTVTTDSRIRVRLDRLQTSLPAYPAGYIAEFSPFLLEDTPYSERLDGGAGPVAIWATEGLPPLELEPGLPARVPGVNGFADVHVYLAQSLGGRHTIYSTFGPEVITGPGSPIVAIDGQIAPLLVAQGWGADYVLALSSPVDTFIVAAPPTIATTAAAAFEFVSDDPMAWFECRFDLRTWFACQSPHHLEDLASGPHRFEVRAVTPDGRVDATPARHDWFIDVPPRIIVRERPPLWTNRSQVVFRFESDVADVRFDCRLDAEPWAPCSSPHTVSVAVDGPHELAIVATTPFGTMSDVPTALSWNLDTRPPEIQVITAPVSPWPQAEAEIHFAVDEPVRGLFCSILRESEVVRPAEPCASPLAVTELVYGDWLVEIVAVDLAGNPGVTSVTWSVPDTTPPDTWILEGPDSPTTDRDAVLVFAASEPATFECSLNGASFSECTSPRLYSCLDAGLHQFRVRATDLAGLVDPTPAEWSWRIRNGAECDEPPMVGTWMYIADMDFGDRVVSPVRDGIQDDLDVLTEIRVVRMPSGWRPADLRLVSVWSLLDAHGRVVVRSPSEVHDISGQSCVSGGGAGCSEVRLLESFNFRIPSRQQDAVPEGFYDFRLDLALERRQGRDWSTVAEARGRDRVFVWEPREPVNRTRNTVFHYGVRAVRDSAREGVVLFEFTPSITSASFHTFEVTLQTVPYFPPNFAFAGQQERSYTSTVRERSPLRGVGYWVEADPGGLPVDVHAALDIAAEVTVTVADRGEALPSQHIFWVDEGHWRVDHPGLPETLKTGQRLVQARLPDGRIEASLWASPAAHSLDEDDYIAWSSAPPYMLIEDLGEIDPWVAVTVPVDADPIFSYDIFESEEEDIDLPDDPDEVAEPAFAPQASEMLQPMSLGSSVVKTYDLRGVVRYFDELAGGMRTLAHVPVRVQVKEPLEFGFKTVCNAVTDSRGRYNCSFRVTRYSRLRIFVDGMSANGWVSVREPIFHAIPQALEVFKAERLSDYRALAALFACDSCTGDLLSNWPVYQMKSRIFRLKGGTDLVINVETTTDRTQWTMLSRAIQALTPAVSAVRQLAPERRADIESRFVSEALVLSSVPIGIGLPGFIFLDSPYCDLIGEYASAELPTLLGPHFKTKLELCQGDGRKAQLLGFDRLRSGGLHLGFANAIGAYVHRLVSNTALVTRVEAGMKKVEMEANDLCPEWRDDGCELTYYIRNLFGIAAPDDHIRLGLTAIHQVVHSIGNSPILAPIAWRQGFARFYGGYSVFSPNGAFRFPVQDLPWTYCASRVHGESNFYNFLITVHRLPIVRNWCFDLENLSHLRVPEPALLHAGGETRTDYVAAALWDLVDYCHDSNAPLGSGCPELEQASFDEPTMDVRDAAGRLVPSPYNLARLIGAVDSLRYRGDDVDLRMVAGASAFEPNCSAYANRIVPTLKLNGIDAPSRSCHSAGDAGSGGGCSTFGGSVGDWTPLLLLFTLWIYRRRAGSRAFPARPGGAG